MRVSLLKDPESNSSGILVHVEISEIDALPKFIYSHSFRYKVPSDNDGEIIIYNNKITARDDVDGIRYSFALAKCRNSDCKKENQAGCPVIAGNPNRLLVTNIFHTRPTEDALGYFGIALFKAIFSGVAEQLLLKIEPMHPNGRIFLQLNSHDDLDDIPWEYAKDRPTSFLIHQRRFARLCERQQDPLPKLPLRIVAVFPDPIIPPNEPGPSLPDLHLGEQFKNLINGFSKNKKKVKLERVFPPTVSQVGALLDTKATMSTLFHFMGHCVQDGDSRTLVFEHEETSKLEYINASRLSSVLKNARLAFLSACNSRDIARVLVEYGVRYTIGADRLIPDDLARKFEFEFYKFLSNGFGVEMAMYQARTSFQVKGDIRQSNYFTGAMVLYLSTVDEDDGAFQCNEGAPDINTHEPQHNLIVLDTTSVVRGHKKELAELYSQLRNMVLKGQTRHVYTIKGIDSQGFVAVAMRRMAHLFPGGIFAWAFDKEKTSAKGYFQRLIKVIFSEDICAQLMREYDSDVDDFGLAIIQQFRTGSHATCLLILDHADILDLGRKEKNMHAEKLGCWLERVTSSVQDTVKILLTSNEPLDWLKGGLMHLGDINSQRRGLMSTWDMRKGIHGYFEYYSMRISHSKYFQGKKCFYDIPEENRAFVDRPFIQEMKAALTGEYRILALTGLGGMGKSQLMLRYCYLNEAAYDFIFWLTVDNWSTAVHSYRKLADYLGLDEKIIKDKDSEQKVISWVRDWFQERKNWLLLLDNADDEMGKKIFELLPRKGGDIIFTTRQFISPTRATVIRVDKMQEQEAIHLLYGVDPVDQKSKKFNHAQEIITELDCMPLAINLARAYIKRTRTSFKVYLDKFKKQKERVELLEYSDKTDSSQYEYTVATVWQLSFERIRTLNPTAVQVLEVCAFLHPKNIPTCLFKQQRSALELISNEHDSEDVIEEAITVLVEFSFVTQITKEMEDKDKEDPANDSDLLTIHRLVQKVIYDTMDSDKRLRWSHNIATALNHETDYNYFNVYTHQTQRIMNMYLSHIRQFVKLRHDLSQIPLMSKDLWSLLDHGVRYLIFHGMYFDVEELAQLSIEISQAIYGPMHPDTAESLKDLADLYFHQGKYDEAEPLYKRALAICEEVLGPMHPDTATAVNNLALLYFSQGKYDEAELYKRALAIREEVLGPMHPDTARSVSGLAGLYFHQGKHDEAEPLFKRALAIREEVLGSMHPNTARSVNNLASLYFRQGKCEEAEPLYKQALAIREEVLGPMHPEIATSVNDMAGLYKSQGKYDEAESLYKRALAIREEVLGPMHPDTAISVNNLANLYSSQDKYDEAEPLYKRVRRS